MTGYALFFAGTAAIGIPTLILCVILASRVRRQRLALEAAPA